MRASSSRIALLSCERCALTILSGSWTQAGMQPSEMFEEVPIRINNSQLIQAYLVEMREAQPLDTEFQRLLVDDHAPVAKSLGLLSDAIEEFARDQTAFLQHIRNVSKQQAQQGAHLAKRRAENVQREMNGEPPIVEDTSKNPLFKPIPPPSRNDRALLSQQVCVYVFVCVSVCVCVCVCVNCVLSI
jgi:hypothetical protein